MAQRKGRVFLHSDTGSRSIDRVVNREVRVVYYPTSTTSDLPIVVYLGNKDGAPYITVYQESQAGVSERLFSTTLPATAQE